MMDRSARQRLIQRRPFSPNDLEQLGEQARCVRRRVFKVVAEEQSAAAAPDEVAAGSGVILGQMTMRGGRGHGMRTPHRANARGVMLKPYTADALAPTVELSSPADTMALVFSPSGLRTCIME